MNRTCVELNKELMSPECQAAMSDGDSGSGAVREACKNDFRRLCTPEENSRAQESGPGRTLRGGKGKSHKNGGKNKDKDQDEGKDERRGRRGRGGNKHKGERGGKDGDYARHRERFDELKKCIEEQKRLFSEACQAAMAAHDEQHNSTAAAAGTGKDEPTTSTTTMMPLPTAAASLAFVRVEEEEQAEAELNGYHRNHHGHWLHDHLKAVVIAGAAGGLALISLVIVVRRRRRRSKCSCHATKARPEEPSEQSEELPAVKTVVVSAPVVVA